MTYKKGLLVIDVQYAMFNLSRPLYNGDSVLKNIIALIDRARAAKIPVVFMQHCGSENSIFKKDSEGWRIHPLIVIKEDDYIVEKRFSDSFQGTTLDEILKKLNVNHLIVCGLVSEGCVDTTVRSAYSRGYNIELAGDSHSTTDSENLTGEQIVKHHNEVLRIFSEVKKGSEIKFNE